MVNRLRTWTEKKCEKELSKGQTRKKVYFLCFETEQQLMPCLGEIWLTLEVMIIFGAPLLELLLDVEINLKHYSSWHTKVYPLLSPESLYTVCRLYPLASNVSGLYLSYFGYINVWKEGILQHLMMSRCECLENS